jgi:hypothetical protein
MMQQRYSGSGSSSSKTAEAAAVADQTWSFVLDLDCQLMHVDTEDARMIPYVQVYLDEAFAADPVIVYLPRQNQQQPPVSVTDNVTRPYRVKQVVAVQFKNVRLNERAPLYDELIKHAKAKVFETARLGLSFYTAVRDDDYIPVMEQAGVASLSIGRLIAASGGGGKKGSALAYDEIHTQGSGLPDLGTVKLLSCRVLTFAAQEVASTAGKRDGRFFRMGTVTTSSSSAALDAEAADGFSGGGDVRHLGASDGKQLLKQSKEIVDGYTYRFFNWFVTNFRFEYALSARINAYYDFNTLVKKPLLSFLLCPDPESNADFWANLFKMAMRRHAVRDMPEQIKADDFAGAVGSGLAFGPEQDDLYADLYFRGIDEAEKRGDPLRHRVRFLTELLCLIPTSFRYLGDNVVAPNGEQIAVEDFDSPFESRTGDCEAEYHQHLKTPLTLLHS